uniref:Uncharacterized protein n=1 Tax=Ananas comosus var. bracteatus TaxID=296719 RepID=A0A6V7QN28_ANACO|nr:unnamed protein product [Ananas comosus var. bracteatus]
MVEIGKQRLEIAREMINIAKASQSTIPPIDVCMSRVYNLVCTTTIRAIAAGMSLRVESDRHLFMTLNDELALVWIDLQVVEMGELLNRYVFSSPTLVNIMTLLDEEDDYWDQVFVILYQQDYLTFAANTLHRRPCRTRPFSGMN